MLLKIAVDDTKESYTSYLWLIALGYTVRIGTYGYKEYSTDKQRIKSVCDKNKLPDGVKVLIA